MTKREFQQFLESLKKMLFYFFDFDGTIAHTFLYIPHSEHDLVADAYIHALVHIWDTYALELLESIHGLQNRAPGELIQAILDMEEKCSPGSGRQSLIESAKKSFTAKYLRGQSRQKVMSDYVPAGKGFPWEWDEQNPEKTITEFLVRAKLDTLLRQIGPHYPTPCPGFKHFYTSLLTHQERTGITIIPGIISSGHEIFIQRTFAAWELPCPELLLTDDDMRGSNIADLAQASKPNPILMDMLLKIWLTKQKVLLTAEQYKVFKATILDKTVYFGDDPNKDGKFAANLGVPFGHFDPNLDPDTDNYHPTENVFRFFDWRLAEDVLNAAFPKLT